MEVKCSEAGWLRQVLGLCKEDVKTVKSVAYRGSLVSQGDAFRLVNDDEPTLNQLEKGRGK